MTYIRQINTKIISPLLYFSVSWSIVLVAYSLYWSELLPKLTIDIVTFFIFLISVCFILFRYSKSLEFKFEINKQKIERKLKRGGMFCILLFLLEVIAEKGFPLLFIIKGQFVYGAFGLPFVHVILYALSSIYICISFLAYKITQNKKFHKYTVFFFFPYVLCFTRSAVIYNFLYILMISFSFKKINLKIIFRTLLLSFIIVYMSIIAFGYLGELRSGNDNNKIGGYIEAISYPTEKFDKTGLSPLFLWGYIYITTPLGNLQNTIDSGAYSPCSSVDNAELILYHFLPDIFKKRLFPNAEEKTKLIVPYFNVSSIFTDAWAKLGWLGMIYSFLGMLTVISVIYNLKKRNNIYSYLSFIFLSTIIFFNMFTNMFNFMGLAPQFWIAFLMSFSWKKVFKLEIQKQ